MLAKICEYVPTGTRTTKTAVDTMSRLMKALHGRVKALRLDYV